MGTFMKYDILQLCFHWIRLHRGLFEGRLIQRLGHSQEYIVCYSITWKTVLKCIVHLEFYELLTDCESVCWKGRHSGTLFVWWNTVSYPSWICKGAKCWEDTKVVWTSERSERKLEVLGLVTRNISNQAPAAKKQGWCFTFKFCPVTIGGYRLE